VGEVKVRGFKKEGYIYGSFPTQITNYHWIWNSDGSFFSDNSHIYEVNDTEHTTPVDIISFIVIDDTHHLIKYHKDDNIKIGILVVNDPVGHSLEIDGILPIGILPAPLSYPENPGDPYFRYPTNAVVAPDPEYDRAIFTCTCPRTAYMPTLEKVGINFSTGELTRAKSYILYDGDDTYPALGSNLYMAGTDNYVYIPILIPGNSKLTYYKVPLSADSKTLLQSNIDVNASGPITGATPYRNGFLKTKDKMVIFNWTFSTFPFTLHFVNFVDTDSGYTSVDFSNTDPAFAGAASEASTSPHSAQVGDKFVVANNVRVYISGLHYYFFINVLNDNGELEKSFTISSPAYYKVREVWGGADGYLYIAGYDDDLWSLRVFKVDLENETMETEQQWDDFGFEGDICFDGDNIIFLEY